MTSTPVLPSLTGAFAAASRDDWLAVVTKALKGADYNRRLVSRTADGIALEPIYPVRRDAGIVSGRNAGKPWGVTVRMDDPDPKAASAQALADLEGGAGALALVFAGAPSARGFGLTVDSLDDLDACLADVMLDFVGLRLEPAPGGRVNAALMAALVDRRGYNPARMNIAFGLDPIGVQAATGQSSGPWPTVARRLAETIAGLRARGFAGPFITCDGRPFHEAGASEAQELGVALAGGIAYAQALAAAGMPLGDAFAALSWTLAVDADELLGIAKLRALRRLWAQVLAASGEPPSAIAIHAETAWRGYTRRDPAVNMLRATTAVFAAAVGGADSITVLPHTSALGLPDALSRRIARNTQLVLQEETNLWRVADPAAGSGAIEALTDELSAAGWKAFQEIEAEGGLVASLEAGRIQARIAAVAAARQKDLATRKAAITGTSEFPSLNEPTGGISAAKPSSTPALHAADLYAFDALLDLVAKGARRADVVQAAGGGASLAALPTMRLAEPFERLRDAADAAPERPKVFLANLGPLAEHGARATWIANLLAAGGIATIGSDGFTASQAAGAAFAASGARIACLCGSDATYAQLAEAAASALKAAGATHVLLAGRPGESEAALKAAGVDQFLFAGQDVVAALAGLHAALGVKAAA